MPLGGRRSFSLSLGHSLARPVGEPCGSISGRARRRKFLPGMDVRQILLSMALTDAGKTGCSCSGQEKVIKASEGAGCGMTVVCPCGCQVSDGAGRESLWGAARAYERAMECALSFIAASRYCRRQGAVRSRRGFPRAAGIRGERENDEV